MTSTAETTIIYTPDNEPYLGRESVFRLDKTIVQCLTMSREIAPRTYIMTKSKIQEAACHLIPQGLSIALSLRELVRQGHLFGGLALLRPLAERVVILYYLQNNPNEMIKWERGWRHNEAPSLANMITKLGAGKWENLGPEITRPLNSIIHGKPDSAAWTLTNVGEDQWAHVVSKILDNPGLCDKVCYDADSWLMMAYVMMGVLFPQQQDIPTP
jgi:hypothetical protein